MLLAAKMYLLIIYTQFIFGKTYIMLKAHNQIAQTIIVYTQFVEYLIGVSNKFSTNSIVLIMFSFPVGMIYMHEKET